MKDLKIAYNGFADYCVAKYGKGVRKSVYLVCVYYAGMSEKEGAAVEAVAAKAKRTAANFVKWCARKGVSSRFASKPMWQIAIDYCEGVRK